MNRARKFVGLTACLAAVLASTPLWAGERARTGGGKSKRGAVLESYVHTRPQDAEYLVAPILDYLSQEGFVSGEALGQVVGGVHSRPGTGLKDDEAARARRLIQRSHQSFIYADFEEAVKSARSGLEILMSRPAHVARQPHARDDIYLALIVLSLAQNRLGKSELSSIAMAEFIRSFPDRELSRKRFGPEAIGLYRAETQRLENAGKGTLKVLVEDADVMVFINERYVGLGSVDSELYPGTYRIYTQRGATPGRVYSVAVTSHETRELRVSPEVEESLQTGPDYVGFLFANEGQRIERELRMALAVGRAIRAPEMVIIGIQEHQGNPSIVATSLSVSAAVVERAAAITLPRDGAPSASQLRALARFVVDGRANDSIVVIHQSAVSSPQSETPGPTSSTAPAPPRDTAPRSGISSAWRWSAWAAGIGSLALGGYLLSIDGDPNCGGSTMGACPDLYETTVPAFAALGAGATLVAAGFVLWSLEGDGAADGSRVAVSPGSLDSLSVQVSGRF